MEIAVNPSVPTYAGGLGVLAGDTLRAAADLDVPLVAVTLLHRRGYFHQRLDAGGHQTEEPVAWPVDDFLEPLTQRVAVEIENRVVQVRAWRFQMTGVSGFHIPIYFLDTDLPDNSPWDRRLTDSLYGGDEHYRLCQEAVLGLGGVRMLRALGHRSVTRFHLNEGHAALLILALLEERLASHPDSSLATGIKAVSGQCVFTTHTPVPAGHDQFARDMVRRVLGEELWKRLQACGQDTVLNMTDLALRCSRYVNGVAIRHGEVSRSLFPGYPIHSITNGVHAATWAAPSFEALYDRRLPAWRQDALSLRFAQNISGNEIWEAHRAAKHVLVDAVNHAANAGFDRDVLTLGFARRATAYKRAMLVFHDLERLEAIVRRAGALQLVFAGKAHPLDHEGKEIIRSVHAMRVRLRGRIAVAYLPNYDMALAKVLCAGVDVWLNTPLPPHEASGTSGMKAAVNGVPSLSVLDGWWIEGHVEGVTGWAIGGDGETAAAPDPAMDARHAASLYEKLDAQVLPCFYRQREGFIEMMRRTIALNASFFNTHRMVRQYVHLAYAATPPSDTAASGAGERAGLEGDTRK